MHTAAKEIAAWPSLIFHPKCKVTESAAFCPEYAADTKKMYPGFFANESKIIKLVSLGMLRKVNLEITVLDYDRIGGSDPIGKVMLGYNRKKLEKKHWAEMVDNPRRPIIHWHVLQASASLTLILKIVYYFSMHAFHFKDFII